jgi:hypothetical protein
MADDILDGFNKKDVSQFNKDIVQVVRIAKEVDRFYGEWRSEIDRYIPKYKKFINCFNKKYRGVNIKVKVCLGGIKTKLLLKEKSIRGVFDNAASKIIGLKAVGVAKFNVVDVTDSEGFMKEVDKGKNKLHITYYDPELGTRNVFLSYDKKEKKVELHYDIEQIIYDTSPEFKIACFYALKGGYKRKIKINEEGSKFGFDDLLSEREKAEWFHKMNPHFLE